MKFVLICLIFITSSAFGSSFEKSPKKLFSKVENLNIQKDRLKASILLKSTQTSGWDAKELSQYKSLFKKTARIFYTNKAHKLVEMAKSFLATDINKSEDLFNRAGQLEPYNLQIVEGIVFVKIRKNECKKAVVLARRGIKIYPQDNNINRLLERAQFCLNQNVKLKVSGGQVGLFLKLQQKIKGKNKLSKRLFNEVLEFVKNNKNYPEPYYTLWQLKKDEKYSLNFLKKYVELCRAPVNMIKKWYPIEPRICENYENIKQILSNKNVGNL